MESSETAGERPLTKLESQLNLIEAAFGNDFGKKYFDDGTIDYLYVRGVIMVRDAYVAEVARLIDEEDEEDERGQAFVPAVGPAARGEPVLGGSARRPPGCRRRSTPGSARVSRRRITSSRSRRCGPARPPSPRGCPMGHCPIPGRVPAAAPARSSTWPTPGCWPAPRPGIPGWPGSPGQRTSWTSRGA